MSVTLKQLRALREVSETSNFTVAAKRLHTTQSALSASIQELERSLNIKLIDRTTRCFALTSAGKEFLPAATRILADLQTSINNLTTLAALKRGSVILGCPPSIASVLLAGPISSFCRLYPHVTIDLKDNATSQFIGKLRSSELELAIGTLPQPEPDLIVHPLLNARLIAIALKESPLALKSHIPWRALGDYSIIAPSKETSTRQLIEQTFLKATGKPFRPVFEAAYWTTIVSMVEAGLGVAVTPSYTARYLLMRKLRVIQLVHPVVNRDIGVILHKDRTLSPAASAFVQHLKAEIGLNHPGIPGDSIS